MAIRRSYRVLCDSASLNIRSDKRANPPHGLFGGSPGAGSMTVIHREREDTVVPALPTSPVPLQKGDVVEHTMPAGGGWGNPSQRPRELVARDLMQERISERAAREIYRSAA
jgi:N-methylhydantoinase B